MKLVATVVDSDYKYIDTFINFLGKLAGIINDMFGGFIDNIGQLLKLTEKEDDAAE